MKQFYLQDSRSYRGNDMCWWSINGQYTTDLSQARIFSQVEAQLLHNHRSTDIPWPKDYIDEKVRPVVDRMHVNKRKALLTAGIQLHALARGRTDYPNCHHCGAFMNEAQRYICGCPKCTTDLQEKHHDPR